jgi:flagellar biosynthesis anti-sigma factor FlgM
MKINEQPAVQPATIGRPAAAPQAAGRPAPEGAGIVTGSDRPAVTVALSGRSRELHDARRAAADAPDVRSEVVNAIKGRIAAGTYAVDPERIAHGILDTLA